VENADVKTIREQIELLSLAEGFFSSSVLFTLQKLKIFQLLGEESKSVEELAARLGCQVSPLQRLLNAGVMLKLLRAEGQVYRLTEAARAVLLPTSRGGYLGDWIELMEQFSLAYNRLDQAVLRNGPSIDPEEYLGGDPSHTRKYIYAMHNYAAVRGKELSRYIDGKHLNSLLDLGCGPGTFAYHLAAGNPQMRLTLADLPGVLEVTREITLGYQLPNEMEFLSLDASRDDIPGSYDLVRASWGIDRGSGPASPAASSGWTVGCLGRSQSSLHNASWPKSYVGRLGEMVTRCWVHRPGEECHVRFRNHQFRARLSSLLISENASSGLFYDG